MIGDLLQRTKYHDQFELVLKKNTYHDATGAFTSKDKAAPKGPAQMLADKHTVSKTTEQILEDTLPDQEERLRYRAAEDETDRLHNSGLSSKASNTKPGTGSYTADRLRLHRAIIAKLFGDETEKTPLPGEKPKLTLVGGRSGSGKGNFEEGVGSDAMTVYNRRNTVVLDPDEIKGMLPGYDPALASFFHKESADIFDKAAALAKKRGLNLALDFTMSHDKTQMVRSFKKAGYEVEAHYVHKPIDKAVAFAIRRWKEPSKVTLLDGTVKKFPGGRLVPRRIVQKQTENDRFFDKLTRVVDRWSLYDNSTDRHDPKLVDSSDGRHRVKKWYKDALGKFTSKIKAVLSGGRHEKGKTFETDKWTADHAEEGRVLNGVPLKTENAPDFSQSVNRSFAEPKLHVPFGKHVSAGVVVTEPDGRMWVVQPKNMYGGYKNTFPKGTVKPGEDLQETAARETWEESGLVVKITGHLTDVERTTSVARFYTGERIGGAPWAFGKETHAVKLVPVQGKATESALENVLGKPTSDQKVLESLRSKTQKQEYVWVLKTNKYHDQFGSFTTKERAVAPGWYKSHGGHHVEVGAEGKIVSGSHAGKTAQSKHFQAGPFATHAEAKAYGATSVAPPKPPPKLPETPSKPVETPTLGAPAPLSARSAKIEALLKSGTAPKHAVLQVQQDAKANASKVKALGSGAALDRAVKEYSETPTQDLDVLTGIEVQNKPVSGQAHCTWNRKVVMGSTSVTGDFRHELGHAIHMSLSPALQEHIQVLHAEALARVAKNPVGKTQKLDHAFYEKTYGVIGRRALDNWHEDFAEHYRGYVKAIHQTKTGKDPQALNRYTEMHPKWSKFWDAYYAGGAA